jgi:ferredoxin
MAELPPSIQSPPHEAESRKFEPTGGAPTVTFLRSNLVVPWDPTARSLLDFAEQSGLSPPFCCRAGVCGTCVSIIKRGAVTYSESPVFELAAGEILLCCTLPTESIDVDI